MKTNNSISSIKEISSESTKEEIAEFFKNKFNFSEKIKENIIKEDIAGDILLDLKDKEFKQLGFKNNQIKIIRDYLSDNYEAFIDTNKKMEKEDLEENLNTIIGSEKLKDIDIKNCLNLTPENISKIGLNIGQSTKLKKFLKKYKQNNKKNIISSSYNESSQVNKIDDLANLNIIQKSNISLNEEKKEDNRISDINQSYSFIWNMIPNLSLSSLWSTNINKDAKINQNNKIITQENNKTNDIGNRIINMQGNILSYVQYKDINTNVEPFYKDSNYNIFFLLVINQEYYNSSISFYEDQSCIQFWKIIINYNHIFLSNKEIENSENNKKRNSI